MKEKLAAAALFSDDGHNYDFDGKYRLWLSISLAGLPGGGCSTRTMCGLLMNSSTARVDDDGFLIPDPTVARMCRYGVREQCGRLIVVNACGVRLTDSKQLHKQENPVGNPLNDECIRSAMRLADVRIVAWGNLHPSLAWRAEELRVLLREFTPLHALAINSDGSPGHPLYLRANAPLLSFHP